MYLIGSRAILRLGHEFYREPKDFDYIVLEKDETLPKYDLCPLKNKEVRVEYHVNPVLIKWLETNKMSLDILFTLKLSHILWNIHWIKNIEDTKWFSKNGTQLIPELHVMLVEQWKVTKNKRRTPNFELNNANFFYDKVKRTIDHDDLHQICKFYDRPIFERLKFDLNKAKIEESLFNTLSHDDKIKVVLEEMFVLTLERRYDMVRTNCKVACFRTLRELVTRLLPEWLAVFTAMNFKEIMSHTNICKEIFKSNSKVLELQ